MTKNRVFTALLTVLMSLLLAVPTFAVLSDGECVIGDVDLDGEVTDWDCVLLARYLAGWNVSAQVRSADVTGDGEITEDDFLRLSRYLAGWDVMLERAPDMVHCSVFVSPDGNDETGIGSIERPYKTLYKAKDKITALLKVEPKPEDITVYLREGEYPMETGLEFGKEQSGSEDCRVTITNYNGEKAEITGSRIFSFDDFTPAPKEIKDVIRDESARDNIYMLDLGEMGVEYKVSASELKLYHGEDSMIPARFPNINDKDGGFLYFGNRQRFDSGTSYVYDETNVVGTWSSYAGVKVKGFFTVDYFDSEANVNGFNTETNEWISRDIGAVWPTGYFYFSSVLDELDREGEYYIDEDNDILYIYAFKDKTTGIKISQLYDDLIKFTGAEYYTLDGLTLDGNLSNAVYIRSDNVTVKNCLIKNTGLRGVDGKARNITVSHCELYNIGGGGIQILTPTLVSDYIPGGIVVENNRIHNFATILGSYNPGVYVNLNSSLISHNEIYDSVAQAIMPGGNDTVIEYNHVYDVCRQVGDAGALYTGGWDASGMIMRYNYFHDITSPNGNPSGFYNDGMGAGKTVFGNVCVRIDNFATQNSSGPYNVMNNNICVDTIIQYDRNAWTAFRPAIIYPMGLRWRDLYAIGDLFCSRMWHARHPQISQIRATTIINPSNHMDVSDQYLPGCGFAGAQIRNNVTIDPSRYANTGYQRDMCDDFKGNNEIYDLLMIETDVKDNYVYWDIGMLGFADPEKGDYSLSDDSVIYSDNPNFEPIPFNEIGNYGWDD